MRRLASAPAEQSEHVHVAPAGAARGSGAREWRAVEEAWRPALWVGALGGLALALLSWPIGHESLPRGDDLIYERMASHPFATHTFPFAYRVGLPWLVHVLPFGHAFSFNLLAFLAAGGAAAVAYLLMRGFGTQHRLAAVLAFALALSPPMLVVCLRQGRNTDIATIFLMMLAAYLLLQRRLLALTVVLAVGVLVRESQLFMIPFAYAVWATRPWDARAMREALMVGTPALLIFLALHLSIHSVGEAEVPGYGGSPIGERFSVLGTGFGDLFTEARRMVSIYGPLWVAAPVALASMAYARRGLVLVAACLISMTFALDWGRMIFLAAPVFYPAGAFTLTRYPRWRLPALATFALLIAGYAIYMNHSGVRTGIIDSPPPPYPVR
jgi:hypothetical protein